MKEHYGNVPSSSFSLIHHYSLFVHAVDFDGHGLGEAYMAYVFGLCFGRKGVEHVLTEDAVAEVGVDCQVADTEAGEVLEEVGTLGGVDMEVGESDFDDDFGGGDIWPFDWDA